MKTTTELRKRYREARAFGCNAAQALRHAHIPPPEPIDWDGCDGAATVERDGYTVRLTCEVGEHETPEDAGLGRYSDTWEDGAFDLFHGEDRPYARTFRYFHPELDAEETRSYCRANGYGRHAAWIEGQRARRQCLESVEAWNRGDAGPYVVTARAFRSGVELGSAAIGGVWMEYGNAASERNRDDVARDVIEEAAGEAADTLAALCAGAA